jgi:hypothetical protein
LWATKSARTAASQRHERLPICHRQMAITSISRPRAQQYSVVGINRESVTVKCPVDPRYGRFSGSPRCRLPHGLIAQ